MTAISKAWVTLTDAATDADSPVDQALVQGIRDDLVHLREWLGASYTAGAVQDHNHDGVNSAIVEVGPNALRNGSFEIGLSNWTASSYSGGAVNTSSISMDGATSLAITSTVLANGGGQAESQEFMPLAGYESGSSEGNIYSLIGKIKASVSGVSANVKIVWYDASKAQISTTTVYSSTSVPTGATQMGSTVTAPYGARFARVLITGGVPATGTATGTVYFDGLVYGIHQRRVSAGTNYTYSSAASESSNFSTTATTPVEVANGKVLVSGVLTVKFDSVFLGGNPNSSARVYRNGIAYGTQVTWNNSVAYSYSEDLEFSVGDTVQLFLWTPSASTASIGGYRFGTATPEYPVAPYEIGRR